jgi:hypothetical protein
MNTQDLKVGSIVKMAFATYANEAKEDWTIIRRFQISDDNTEMIDYVANCVVSNVTAKFFQVIIPHSNNQSVKMSKNCFIDTKSSYADLHNFRAEIVSI